MIYKIENIVYDTEDVSNLPKVLEIEVNEEIDNYEKIELISDEISNITGFCHKGFSTTPNIDA